MGNLPSQLSFDHIILVEESGHSGKFVLMQVTGLAQRVHAGLVAEFASDARPHSVQILQGIDRLFFRRDVNAEQTGHVRNPEQ